MLLLKNGNDEEDVIYNDADTNDDHGDDNGDHRHH